MAGPAPNDAHGYISHYLDVSGRDPVTAEQEKIDRKAGEAGTCDPEESHHQEAYLTLDDEDQGLHITSELPSLSLSRHLCETVSQSASRSETANTQTDSTMQQHYANSSIESTTDDLPPSIPASLFIPSNYELSVSPVESNTLLASSAAHNENRNSQFDGTSTSQMPPWSYTEGEFVRESTQMSQGRTTLTLRPRFSRSRYEHRSIFSHTEDYRGAESLPILPSDVSRLQGSSVQERDFRNPNISSQDNSMLTGSRFIDNENDDTSFVLQVSSSGGGSRSSSFISLSPSSTTSQPPCFRVPNHAHHIQDVGECSTRSSFLLGHIDYNAAEKTYSELPEALTDEVSLSASPSKVAKPVARHFDLERKMPHDIVSSLSPPQRPQAEYISPSRTSAFQTHKKSRSALEAVKSRCLSIKNDRNNSEDNQQGDNIEEEQCFKSLHSWDNTSDTENFPCNQTVFPVGSKKRSRSFPPASFQNIMESRSNAVNIT